MEPNAFQRSVNRRQVVVGGAGAVATICLLSRHAMPAAARQSAGDLSSLGLPELKITITDSAFDGVPESTAAGRYLVTLTNNMTSGDGAPGVVGFMSPAPIGQSAADLLAFLSSGAGGPASPEAGASSEEGEEEEGPLPDFIYQLYFAGGATALPGSTGQAVIDLKPGEYVVWGDDPTAPQRPSIMNVTGDFPATVADPAADITATLVDFGITLEGNLTPGQHILKIHDDGAQPHFLSISQGPDTMTVDKLMSAFMGTPVADGITESDIHDVFYSPTQSLGTTTFHPIDLPEGTFMAVCFFPTAGTGVPHAMNGMIDVFTVSGSSTPQA